MQAAQPSEYEQNESVEPTHFILCLNDGEQISFVLEHNPKVVHGDGFITVVDEDITLEYKLTDVHKYILGVPTATGINDANDSESGAGDIRYNAGDVILSGFEASLPVYVTDVNGVAVYSGETDVNGGLVVRMSQYPSGVYIIKVQNKTFKFIKR